MNESQRASVVGDDFWSWVRKVQGDFPYLFCSLAKLDDPDGQWIRRFTKEAAENGYRAYTEGGHLYIRPEPNGGES